jgi:hypothetical protein
MPATEAKIDRMTILVFVDLTFMNSKITPRSIPMEIASRGATIERAEVIVIHL